MKQFIFAAYILCLIISLASCQDNDNLTSEDGYGYIQVSAVELDKSVIPQKTKSMERSAETLALDIIKDGEVVRHVDDWTLLQSESIVLRVGEYVLRAYSTEKDEAEMQQGFDTSPYYAGEKAITIQKDKAQTVDITCTLAQSMVSINYSANFKKAFSAYESVVSNEYGDVTFLSTETRSAYFRAGKALNAELSITNTDGNSFTHSTPIAEEAQKRYHYKVNYDVTNDGKGSFTFEVDQTIREYKVTIEIPILAPELELETTEANAWGKFAYIYGTAVGETKPVTFQYKETDGTDWTSVEATLADGKYMAKTNELEFATSYDYRIVCDDKEGDIESFTTESFQEIPNLDFEVWTKSGKNWHANPVADDYNNASAYWATGNTGVTSFLAGSKDPITVPVEGADAYKGKSAKLTTITGVTLVGSASGNLFIGKYKTNMTNPSASVTFGRPYSGARPVSLSGYYKYESKPMSTGSKPGGLTTDQCHIYLRLWNAAGKEIGYGEFIGKETVPEYTPFSFDITYYEVEDHKPATITIVATSSRYGGDFSGASVVGQVGKGSTLWVDEFELSYYK